jgi:hypothetical protein
MMRIAAVFLTVFVSASQVGADTIFSFHGVGDPIRRVDARSRSMGGGGRSLVDGLNFSTHNPALLAAFRKASASVQFITQRRSLGGGAAVNDGDVGAFQIVVPFGLGPVLGIGLEPLTDMDFGAVENTGTGDLGYELQVEATGGIQSVSLGLGIRVGQRLYLGGRLNWVAMGTFNESWTKTFNGADIFFSHDEIIRTHRGWLPSLGFIYTPTARWSFGGNVQIGRQIRQRQVHKNRFVSVSSALEVETQSYVDMAHEFGFGATYLAGYRWLASFDVSRSLWGQTGAGRFNTWDISAGALWRTGNPDLLVRSRRFELTAGFHYRSLYFPTTTNSQISELGASFGIGLPFKNDSGRFRYVIEVGQRGDRAKHGASERFIQQSFSVTGFVR